MEDGKDFSPGGDGTQKEEEEGVEIDLVVVESSPDEEPSLKFPPGCRFHPKDHELILHYLLPKLQNKPLPYNVIKDVNLCNYNPEDLTAKYKCTEIEGDWFFFTPRDRKYKNGSRPSRNAGNGYWKATGGDEPIVSNDIRIGVKKTLVFYEGKPPKGTKSNWCMNEYRIQEGVFKATPPKRNRSSMRLDDWVLCHIYKNKRFTKNVSKESPADCSRDHENESSAACRRDYDDEQMKMVIEESSHGNKLSTSEIASVFDFSGMPNDYEGSSFFGDFGIVFHENEPLIACRRDYPIACRRDYENETPNACERDYDGGEQMKSSHDNKRSPSEINSVFNCSGIMSTTLPNYSVGLDFSSDYGIPCYENESPKAFQRGYGDEQIKMEMKESSSASNPEITSVFDYSGRPNDSVGFNSYNDYGFDLYYPLMSNTIDSNDTFRLFDPLISNAQPEPKLSEVPIVHTSNTLIGSV